MLRLVPTAPTASLLITTEIFPVSSSEHDIIQLNLISQLASSGMMNKLQNGRTALIITARSHLYKS